MDGKTSGFKKIAEYCKDIEKGGITQYVAYCIYKQQFNRRIEERTQKGEKITSKDFEKSKQDHLTEEQIERYVKESEELLLTMVNTYQEDFLKKHQQELRQDLTQMLSEVMDTKLKERSVKTRSEKVMEWVSSITTNVVSNAIAWFILIVLYMYIKKYIPGILNTLNINI